MNYPRLWIVAVFLVGSLGLCLYRNGEQMPLLAGWGFLCGYLYREAKHE